MKQIQIDYLGKKLSIETGKVAKQANGSVVVTYGDTVTLVTATSAKKEANFDFFPLTCVYQVKAYSQGRILGGFVKRERMPSEHETLMSRMIDRPLRPLFDEGFSNETQVIATVISYDNTANPAVASLLGASAACYISDIPYNVPVASINVGRINGEFVGNPSPEQLKESDIDLTLVAKEDAIVMVEAGSQMVSEEDMVEALKWGHEAVQPLIQIQKELQKEVGKEKMTFTAPEVDKKLEKEVKKVVDKELKKILVIPTKEERYEGLRLLKQKAVEKIVTEDSEYTEGDVAGIFDSLKKKVVRDNILKKGIRIDGRAANEVRPIDIEIGVLPKAHGSALFTRGETQALVVTTLGTKDDAQMVDDPTGLYFKDFYLHYNFPAYSVGEVRRLAAPGRREIGHGNLAERGLKGQVPAKENFPYTIRIVSEITESNGSSSMASVCGGSLAMMDAGVQLGAPVAGVAMGMVAEGKKHVILTDILGDEDHVGDMDFKVVGTKEGITALQMDIKIDGLSMDTVAEALTQAKEGRLHILGEMEKVISEGKESLSNNAPRFIQHKIPTSKIRDIIGPGGKIIKGIQAESGAKIEIDDSGVINIASADQESAEKALAMVRELTQEVEVGVEYRGEIKKVMDFGAFVEVLPNTEGLVHISEFKKKKVAKVTEGEYLTVKAVGFDKRGKLKLALVSVG